MMILNETLCILALQISGIYDIIHIYEITEWPVAEWPKEALCLWSIFLPKEVYFWPWKKYKLRKKLIFRQNHLWITPFLTNNFREIFYQFYIPCTRLQSCRHHLTLIFDKSFSAEFQWKIFYFFGIFFL